MRVYLARNLFTKCHSDGVGGGLAVGFDGVASDTDLVFDRLSFRDCTAGGNLGGNAGGVMLYYSNSATSSSVTLTDCIFNNNTADAGYGGGGLFAWYRGRVYNSSLDMHGCTFAGNHGTNGFGGAMTVEYLDTVTAARVSFNQCAFINNTAIGGFGGHGGGGLCVWYRSRAMQSSIQMTDSTFIRNQVAVGGGGGMAVAYDSNAIDTSVQLTRCYFVSNRAIDGGNAGGFDLSYSDQCMVDGAVVTMSSCSFTHNTAAGNGGAIAVALQASASLSVVIDKSTLSDNAAGINGGAIYISQSSPNKPTTLVFNMTNTSDPHSRANSWTWCGPCYTPYNGHSYREWDYGTSMLLDRCTLTHNNANDNGGAIAIANVNTTVRSSEVSGNSAAAMAMLRGTTRLRIDGNSRLNGNGRGNNGVALRATVVHSVSSGALEVDGSSQIEFSNSGISNGGAGFVSPLGHVFMDEGGRVSFGNQTTLKCPAGELIVHNISHMSGVLSDWKINCSEMLAIPNVTSENGQRVARGTVAAFAQPTCYQLCPVGDIDGEANACGDGCVCAPCCNAALRGDECRGCILDKCDPFTPASRPCDPLQVVNDKLGPGVNCKLPVYPSTPSLPFSPPMLFSTGMLTCSPCPSGLYR
jgi:predicted outer membrane repeat protein